MTEKTLPPGPWELVAFNTDSREQHARYRSYTSSEAKARAFQQIERIQFSDCGHGIEFQARTATRPRKETVRWKHVDQQLALQKANWHVKQYIDDIKRRHNMSIATMRSRIEELQQERDDQTALVALKRDENFDLIDRLKAAQRALDISQQQ